MAEPAKLEPGSVQIVGVVLAAVWAKAMLNQDKAVWFSQALTGSYSSLNRHGPTRLLRAAGCSRKSLSVISLQRIEDNP